MLASLLAFRTLLTVGAAILQICTLSFTHSRIVSHLCIVHIDDGLDECNGLEDRWRTEDGMG